MRTWSYLVVVGALVGCSGETIDAGTNDGGAGDGYAPASSGGSSGGSSSASTGVFKGYIESFMFPSGSDTVVMNLAFGAGGAVTGTVFFGDGPALAPPTNPDVGYPPGLGLQGRVSPEDFAFTVLQGMVAASRVTLQVDTKEIDKKWCELQTMVYPQYTGNGSSFVLSGYGCLPGGDGVGSPGSSCELDSPQGTTTPVDCGKATLCIMNPVCTCTATSCTVPLSTGDVHFDMQLMGDSLNGSVTGFGASQAYNVHLTRSP